MATENIVTGYDWTSNVGNKSTVPFVYLRSYVLNSNAIMQVINGYEALAKSGGNANEFYEKLYGDVTTSEDEFFIPYFGDSIRSFSNEFGDTFQTGIGKLDDSVAAAQELTQNIATVGNTLRDIYAGSKNLMSGGNDKGAAPGTYVETPMFYQYSKNDSALEIKFQLLNTLNPGSLTRNINLIKKLTKINRPLRQDIISIEPPRIYKVLLPGQRMIRWAYCSNFNVTMLGARRFINGVIHPEAYEITMSLQSLTMEHAGFMDQVEDPSIKI